MDDAQVRARVAELTAEIVPSARAEAYRVWQRAPHALEMDELESLALSGLAAAAHRWPVYCAQHHHDPEAFQFFRAYCVVPDVRVLTSNLRWKPIGSLDVGQELVGVDEFAGGRGQYRRFVRSEVQQMWRRDAPCLRVILTDGREITCSEDHRWLIWGRGHKQSTLYNWREARTLTPGIRIAAQMMPWEEEASFEAGWLAGIIDGEGNYSGRLRSEFSRDTEPHYYGIAITQNKGPVLDRILRDLDDMGIPYRLKDKSRNDACSRVHIDQLWAALKLTGSLQLSRLDGSRLWEGRSMVNRLGMNYVEVAAVEPAGTQEVVSMETSSSTYLAEGLVSHNCLRRMRGSMLDYLRSQDWVTRSARTRAKLLRAAGQDRGLSDAELARATGMSLVEVRGTLAAVSARPVSLDAEPHDVAGEDDVEGQAVVSEVLAAMTGVIRRLGEPSSTILVLHYYHGLAVAELAEVVGVTEDEAVRLHQDAILEIHKAMLAVVA
jgi:hypothetical protein